jgi:hypothetical protein
MPNYKMTRYKIIFALTILISSCENRIENSKNVNETETVSFDTIIPFHGFWATEKYINTLRKTKSPRQSQDDGEFFQVPKSSKDRAFPCVYHDGGADFHIIKFNNSYYLKADYDKNDSTEIAFIDNGNKMKIWNKIYVKTQENIGIPEDILFKGQYRLGGKSVTLNADGTITGLDSVKFYSVENDYIGPGMGDVDILYLGKTQTEKLTHCFEFKSDTLLIYEINCKETDEDGTCMDIQKGQLRWTLEKK